jgi:hypothetical protein
LGASRKTKHPAIDARQIASWLGTPLRAADAEAYFECTDLHSGNTVAVPAAALHPDFDPCGCFDANSSGIGVDSTTEDALRQAIVSAVHQLTIEGLANETLGVQLWDAKAWNLANTTEYLLSTASHLDIAGWEIFVAYPTPGFYSALLVEAKQSVINLADIILKTSFSVEEAVDAALTEKIARVQVERGNRQWRDVPLRSGCYSQAAFRLRSVSGHAPQAGDPKLTLDGIANLLTSANRRIIWRDVTPPEVEMTRTFRVVKALLLSQ